MTPRRAKSGAHPPVTFDDVRRTALSLPEVEEGTSYGTPAFHARGVLFLRLKEDNDSLVVRTDDERRAELMAGEPDTYYITDHYLDYPWVLVRLSRVHPDALRDVILVAHRLAMAQPARRTRRSSVGRKRPR